MHKSRVASITSATFSFNTTNIKIALVCKMTFHKTIGAGAIFKHYFHDVFGKLGFFLLALFEAFLYLPFVGGLGGALGRFSHFSAIFPGFQPGLEPCESERARVVAIHLAHVCDHYRDKPSGQTFYF